jgi:hypothetical protein
MPTELHIILNLLLQQLVSDTIFNWKTFYGRSLKSIACGICTQSSGQGKRHDIFFKFFGTKKISALILTNKLTENFAGLATVLSGRMWPAVLQFDHAGTD